MLKPIAAFAKTPGQIAYEEDCRRSPKYADGTRRKSWDQLPRHCQWSWENDPTPREYATA